MVEVVPLGAVSYLAAHREFGAVPLAKPLNPDGRPLSSCVFIVQDASPIESLTDLKGRTVALGPFHATMSHLVARYELMRAGIDLGELAGLQHLDDDDAIAAAVIEGRFEAGAVRDQVAHRYLGQGLRVVHASGAFPSAPLVVRGDLPSEVVAALRDALQSVDLSEARDRESWDENVRYGFTPASDSDYDAVRRVAGQVGGACGESCHSDVEF